MIYPVSNLIVVEFFRENGILGTNVTTDNFIYEMDGVTIKVARSGELSKEDLQTLLAKAQLSIEDFEYFVQKTNATNESKSFA